MTKHNNALESRLFRQSWDDGLLDILAGAGIVGIGLCWVFDLVAIGAVVPAVLAPFWGPLRRKLVEPRAGMVEFSDTRRGRNHAMLIWSAVLGVVMLVLFLMLYARAGSRAGSFFSLLVPGVPALLLALLSAIVGLGLGLQRFFVYAGLLCASGAAVALVDAEPEVAMIGGGVVMALGGVWLLTRFMQIAVDTGVEAGDES